MDQNKTPPREEIEKGQLFVQLVRPIVDVFANMPCDTLKQLPGFTKETYDILQSMKNKINSLQDENIDVTETQVLNHTENDQSDDELNMDMTSHDQRIGVRDNDNMSTNYLTNNDFNIEIEDRDVDNDLIDYSMPVEAVYNNNDIDLQNNDINNDTEAMQGDINDLAVESEIFDDLTNDCVAGNINYSIQDECPTEINSECSVAHDSNDKMEFTIELCGNNDGIEAMDISDDTRNSPLPTFDDDEDDEWKRLLNHLKLYEDYLNGDEAGITEQTNINKKNTETVLRDNKTTPPSGLSLTNLTDVPITDVPITDISITDVAVPTDVSTEVPVDPISSLSPSTEVQNDSYLQHVLQKVFNLDKFKEGQEKVIQDVVNDKINCLIIMPPGSGKSLCYQLPAKMSDGVTIVICQSQLLIHDQLQMLESVDIKVEHLVIRTENISKTENLRIYADLESDQPEIKLLYMVPEKLENIKCMSILMSLYNRKKISRFVIDDAQCIPAWFETRSAYKNLGETLRKFKGVPITVLASSISARVRADIMEKLKIPDGWKEYRISLDVPNLSYNVVEKTERWLENVAEIISTDYMGQSCIVYCPTVNDTIKMAKMLKKNGVMAKTYHAKMDANSRKEVYDEWHSDSHFVMCAMSMFGLGRGKAGVGLVVHAAAPDSLEAYCQQAGRARGAATCLLYYWPRDSNIHTRRPTRDQENQEMDYSDVTDKELLVNHMDAFCRNKTKCRRLQILEYFDDLVKVKCGETRALCDNCKPRHV